MENKLTGLELLGLLSTMIAVMFYRLFVTTKVWLYIAVPMGMKPISMWQAFLLGFVFSIFHGGYNSKVENSEMPRAICASILHITITWGLAYWIGG